jgi:hypothetical protein
MTFFGYLARGFGALALAGITVSAGMTRAAAVGVRCPLVSPTLISNDQSFSLSDPRSGLVLRLESDGRHMAAITRDGKIAWQKNLFDDPNAAAVYPPLIQMPGEPRVSEEQWTRRMHAYVSKLRIDRIRIVSDCEAHVIDHDFGNPLFRGHYVLVGSGTRVSYFLDAKTGDLLAGPIG